MKKTSEDWLIAIAAFLTLAALCLVSIPAKAEITGESEPKVPVVYDEDTRWREVHGDVKVADLVDDVLPGVGEAGAKVGRLYEYMVGNTNAWFSITNYYGMTEVPSSMQLFERRDGEVRTVWDQRNWFDYKIGKFMETDPTRKWSKFQSYSGAVNPLEDYTWIETPYIAIAPGYTWEKQICATANVWVLASNGLVQAIGPDSESYFKISDVEGNTIFKIKKTDAVMVGCSASSITPPAGATYAMVLYEVASQEHPVMKVAEVGGTLREVNFFEEGDEACCATVDWNAPGSTSGHWVARVYPKSGVSGLVCAAEFLKPGETALEMSGVGIFSQGIQCADDPTKKVRVIWNNGNPKLEVMQ